MDGVRLSIIIATTGRPTLAAAIASATSQMRPGDELILVFDDAGDAGDTPRNRVLDSATGTHITFLDDDDEYLPESLDRIRRFAGEHPGRIGIFRAKFGVRDVDPDGWANTNLMETQTSMYVVPNVPGRIGRFGPVPGGREGRLGDYRFIVETVALQGEPIWCDAVTHEIRPEKSALKRLRYRVKVRTRVKRALGLEVPGPAWRPRAYPEAEAWARDLLAEAGRDPNLAARPGSAA